MRGHIAWCYHSDEADVCIMNDVIPTTGVLSPNAFVHVMKTTDYAGQDIIKCTCLIFDFIHHAAHQANPHWSFADTYPDVETLCPHCHFYNEFLQDGFETASSNTLEDLNVPLRMVKKSLEYFNEQVLLLGNVIPSSTTKFSVKCMCSCYLHTWEVHVDLCRWNVQSKNAQQEEGAPVCPYKGYRKSVHTSAQLLLTLMQLINIFQNIFVQTTKLMKKTIKLFKMMKKTIFSFNSMPTMMM